MRAFDIFFLSFLSIKAADPRVSDLGISTFAFGNYKVADMDGDGDKDFIVYPVSFSSFTGQISWFENLGDDSFSVQKHLGYSREQIATSDGLIADTNADGFLELVTISYQYSSSEIQIMDPLGTGDESYVKRITFPHPEITLVGSLNDDSAPLLMVLPQDSSSSFQLQQFTSSGSLANLSEDSYELPEELSSALPDFATTADLDNDGDDDLLISYQSRNTTLIFERISENQFSSAPVASISRFFDHLIDLDEDGDTDLYQDYYWAQNDANFSFTEPSFQSSPEGEVIKTFQGIRSLEIYDEEFVERELQADLSWVETFRQEVPELPSFDLGLGSGLLFIYADLDGDSQDEVFFIRSNPFSSFVDTPVNHLTVFERTEEGYQEVASSAPPLSIDYTNPIAADFDSDGDIDVLMGPSHLGHHYLKLNDGHGNFTLSGAPLNFYPDDLDPADFKITHLKPVHFDSDGHLDLAITFEREITYNNVEAACTIIKGTGPGTFAPTELPEGSLTFVPQGFCDITEFVDWDSDGDLDAIIEGGWRENIDGELSILFRPILGNIIISDALGNPRRAEGHKIVDVDNDGFPDYLAPVYSIEIRHFYIDRLSGAKIYYDPDIHIPFNPQDTFFGTESVTLAAIAFNRGNGTIEEIITLELQLLSQDALGNQITLDYGVIDLDSDDIPEFIIPDYSTDALGNSIIVSYSVLTTPEGEPRNFEDALLINGQDLLLPSSDELKDFDGDGDSEYTTADRFLEPSALGPQLSPLFSFLHGISIYHSSAPPEAALTADFDGDGDLDSLVPDGNSRLNLVRNLIVDERSSITQELMSQGLSGALSTPSADPDDDGLSNAMEYLSGTNPLVSDAQDAADLSAFLRSTKGIPDISFIRRKDAGDNSLEYDLERSTDLMNWQPVPTDSAVVESLDTLWEEVTVEGSTGSGAFFYRTNPQHRP